MEPTHILVVDDHPMYRKGLLSAIESEPDFAYVGEACEGQEAIEKAVELQTDVVLMDVHMPGMNGIDATREIRRLAPHIRVLMLTVAEDTELLFAAMRAGAYGYILKGADQEEIVRAIRAAANNQPHFDPAIARKIRGYLSHPPPEIPFPLFPELTLREREVLELVAQGLSNAEITRRLVLSDHTIRNHVSNIYSKLQVADRAQAIVRARQAGMGGSQAGQ